MEKNLLEQAMKIALENPNIDLIEALSIPQTPLAEHYKVEYKNILRFLEHDKVLQTKYKLLNSALEGLGVFDKKNKMIINKRIDSLKSTMEKMHQQLLIWWQDYENCPISIKVGNTPIGENVCFGYYECFVENYTNITSKIAWKVLVKLKDKALLISDCVLDFKSYSSLRYEDYENSNVRSWCKKLYANNFTNEERQYILTTSVRTPDVESGKITEDEIFILSATEVQKYMPTYEDRFTQATECAKDRHITVWDCYLAEIPYSRRVDGWWTRSFNNGQNAYCVLDHFTTEYRAKSIGIKINTSRNLYNEALKICPMGVRPAMWVKVE